MGGRHQQVTLLQLFSTEMLWKGSCISDSPVQVLLLYIQTNCYESPKVSLAFLTVLANGGGASERTC